MVEGGWWGERMVGGGFKVKLRGPDFKECFPSLQCSSANGMDAVLEVLSKQPSERSSEDVGKLITRDESSEGVEVVIEGVEGWR